MTHSDKKHTAISKLFLTAAATGIGISAVPYAQADGSAATSVRKLKIENPITDDEENKRYIYDPDTSENKEFFIGYDGGGTLITEIANGEIGLGSTDAVTGGQLYSYVPSKIEEKLEEFIQGLPDKVGSESDVKIEYSDKRLTLTLSEDWKEKINNMSNSGGKGEKGEQGEKGDKGENGKSAYEIWKSLDTGKRADKTERDFIDFLKAEADTAFTRTEESDGTMLTAKGKITNERPNGEVRISGLAAGRISPSSSDAVNGAQLFEVNERISSIEQKVDKLDKSMNGGIAKAGAVALLPQPTYAGHSMVSASTAHYNGEQALAIGYSSLSDNGKVILKAGASFNFSGNNTKKPLFGAAFGYQW
ncbi:YadA family autotransporter adhesin [Neisseria lactamica]|uniref:YadA family autotransporter adhesin n=1 Tax=Neisseria lactamica TaxID=486 RepID=UPI0018644298|nr:YadA-like family protein [Neisseria lactamica]